ncbi:MAG: PDZ domain-containing protein [Myxococcales bacterium]|nr:PDZ domain-containing protein [Myxococcales bacterium]
MRSIIARLLPAAFLFVAPLLVAPLTADAASKDSPLICWTLPSLMNRFLESHVAWREITPELEKRIVTLYAERLDPTESLLTESEYAALEKRVGTLIADVQRGRCDEFDRLKADQLKWHKQMEGYVRETLSAPDLQLDRTIELQTDPDKRPRPKTPAERDELRRKLLHFQLANYVRAGTKLDEAKKRLIHRYELITRRVDEQTQADIFSGFLDAFANALDPHTTYFSADDLEDFRISMNLSLEGIGAVLGSRDGYTVVQEVVPGGAADRHGGLRAKDKIIAVAQGDRGEPVDVIDMALRDVVRQIRGKKGTKVKLTVLRQGERTESHDFVITRDKIDLKEQAAKLRWQEETVNGRKLKLAIIELPSFYGGRRDGGGRDCTEDVRGLLEEARRKKADGLLLDLSRNGGGLLQAAVDISGFFLHRGPVVAIDGPSTPSQVLADDDGDVQFNGPMVVLISRGSASASAAGSADRLGTS